MTAFARATLLSASALLAAAGCSSNASSDPSCEGDNCDAVDDILEAEPLAACQPDDLALMKHVYMTFEDADESAASFACE